MCVGGWVTEGRLMGGCEGRLMGAWVGWMGSDN